MGAVGWVGGVDAGRLGAVSLERSLGKGAGGRGDVRAEGGRVCGGGGGGGGMICCLGRHRQSNWRDGGMAAWPGMTKLATAKAIVVTQAPLLPGPGPGPVT